LYELGEFVQPVVVAVIRVPATCVPPGDIETEPPAGTATVNVTEPLPVLELVLSVGDVCGADTGVKVEETPDCPLLE
jgi:hypothetical protein